MASSLQDWASSLGAEEKQAVADDAVVWASQHGLVVGLGDEKVPVALVHAPLAVHPTPFPLASFEKACRAAEPFNKLVDRVAADSGYLQATLAPAARVDDFTASLLRIYAANLELRESRAAEEVFLAINRSDYMLDEPSSTLLQVELNTIASSFGCLSTLVGRLHHYILERGNPNLELQHLPENNATAELADALGGVVAQHGLLGAVAVMVVQPGEKNAYDQEWLQTALWERHKIRMLRRTLLQLDEHARVEGDGTLSVDGHPVAVVYFRAGYSPDDYTSDREWRVRQYLETSTATMCPTVACQLAGSKKVQQDLARPSVLERFVDSSEEAESIRSCFAGLWSLDDLEEPGTAEVLADAAEHPEAYVLKPQREGGGNNLYGEQLARKLAERKGLSAYILMQRIRPPIQPCIMVRNGKMIEVESLSELGIYGTYLRRGKEVIINRQAGHLVRTKAATSDEGGVAAGFAVLDSPWLT